ncbi:MAG: hypothetical protein AAB323_01785, partial [Pseudomonadota bacterium]
LINGLLTVKARWGIYCFVEGGGGGDAGSGLPPGGPDPRPEERPKIKFCSNFPLIYTKNLDNLDTSR